MDTEHDYARYYRILGLRPDCEWRDVRAAYRKKVAIWHPDRLPDIEGIRESAEAKFKDVSIAYQAISTYYNEVGMMPEVGFFDDDFGGDDFAYAGDGDDDFEPYVPPSPPPPRRRPRERRSNRLTWMVVLLLAVFFIVYGMSLQSWDERSIVNRGEELEKSVRDSASRSSSRSDNWREERSSSGDALGGKGKSRITRGMHKKWVLQIQGEPMLREEDTWDYGISKIYFRDDLVTDWYSSPLDPLRVD